VTRRLVIAAAVWTLILAALVPAALFERRHHVRAEERGMRRVLAEIGPLDGRTLAGYRLLGGVDCLTFRRGPEPFALELCVDPRGRVVSVYDRRNATPRIWSLEEEPSLSGVRVSRAQVAAILARHGVRPAGA
jgi:hypothetical protein